MRARGSTAVMADRAPALVEGDDPRTALYRTLEFFPTPPWAARAGGELIQRLDPGSWTCWEPCCGQGHMVHGLKDYFRSVRRTDIFDHGWDGQDKVQDFLARDAGDVWGEPVDWIVTNPPFRKAAEFAQLGLERARRGVALLCRLSLFESAGRYELFFGHRPLTALASFFERVPMELGGWDPNGSTATAYAWFLWRHSFLTAAPMATGIGPGTRARLTRPDDARLFGRQAPAPLLEALQCD